jgi:hypothetical protein
LEFGLSDIVEFNSFGNLHGVGLWRAILHDFQWDRLCLMGSRAKLQDTHRRAGAGGIVVGAEGPA